MLSALKKLFSRSAPAEARSSPRLRVLPKPKEAGSDLPPKENSAPPPPGAVQASVNTSLAEAVILPLSNIMPQIPKELHGKLAPAGLAGRELRISRAQVLQQLPSGSVKVAFGDIRRAAAPGAFIGTADHDSELISIPLSLILSQLRPEDYAARANRRRLEAPEEITGLFGENGEAISQVRILEKGEASPAPQTAAAPSAPAASSPISARLPSASSTPAVSAGPVRSNILPLPTAASPESKSAVAPAIKRSAAAAKPASAPLPRPAATVSQEPLFLVGLEEIAADWPEPVRQEIAQLQVPHAKCAFPPSEMCECLKRGRISYTWEQLRGRIQPRLSFSESSPHGETPLDLPLKIITPLFLEFIRASGGGQKMLNSAHITEFFRKAELAARSATTATTVAPAPAPVSTQPRSSAPAPAPVASSASRPVMASGASGFLSVPLTLVSGGWPDPIGKEIQQLGMSESKLSMPLALIEPGLKQGRVDFSWREIINWLKPCPAVARNSPHGETRLSLPLSVMAPLFMKQKPLMVSAKKTNLPGGIPDIFSDKQPAAEPASSSSVPESSAPIPTFPTAPVLAPEPPAVSPAKQPTSLAELFGEPQKRNWTPNDIVHKTVQLPGVTGALMALQDGLLVAACMPPSVKGETVAAFLPQIMGRLKQYANEFKTGDLKSVTLNMDSAMLHFYNPGIIYFAVLANPDTSLPYESLQIIVRELSRHTR